MKLSIAAIATLCLVVAFSQTSHEAYNSLDATKLAKDGHSRGINDSSCPTWFICISQNSCQYGDEHNYAVVCDARRQESAILDTYCVTYDRKSRSIYLGQCFYNCQNSDLQNKLDYVYSQLPLNPEDLLNESACTDFHRTGLLCGDCEEGYSPFVFSYNLSCVKCPDGHKNWWKFIDINVTTSRLRGVVWFSQVLSAPALVRLLMAEVNSGH